MKKKMRSVKNRLLTLMTTLLTLAMSMAMPITAFATGGAGGTGGATGTDSAWQQVINFFITWIGRIGGVVAFVGAVMFALAIKNNDAEAKQSALLTMIAGFVCIGVKGISSVFGMFS